MQRMGGIMNATVELHSILSPRSSAGKGQVDIEDLSFIYVDNLLMDNLHATFDQVKTATLLQQISY